MSAPPELPGVRHSWLDVDGVRMHVALAGRDDAPAVLLVHGWPQNWWCWRDVLPALADRFRVIAPDLRGHGWSEAPPGGGYDKERLGSDLLAVLDGLGIERVTWIGHDWGAWVGLLAALRAPERIERLLALCIPHPWSAPDPRLLGVMVSYQGPISLPLVGPRIAPAMVRLVLRHGRGREPLSPRDLAVFADHVPPEVTVAMYRTFVTRELPGVAAGRYRRARLEVPSVLMVGARDFVTVAVRAGPVAGQPHLRAEIVDGVGHWLPEQRPDVVIDWALSGRVP